MTGVIRVSGPRWVGYPAAVVAVGATIGLLKLFPQLNESSVALLLLLAVFFCASIWQSGPGVVAALLATLGFNFFFIQPLYTLTVQDPRNVAALFVFLISGLLIGRLSAMSRRRLELLEAERRDLIALTQLSQGFLADTNRESLLGVAADRLRQALHCREVAILLADEKGGLGRRVETAGTVFREDLAELAYRQGNSAAFPSDLGGTDIYLPIPVGLQRAGTLVARGLQSSERMAEACALLLGLAVERERFLALARAAEETRTSEQMKSTLLAQLAHDLKTPVAAARGAIENWEADSGGSEASRAAGTQLDALSRRVGELMDLVRLDSGAARPRPERVTCARDRGGGGRPIRRGAGRPLALHRSAAARPRGPGGPVADDGGARPWARERRALLARGLDDPRVGRGRHGPRLLPRGRPGKGHPGRRTRPGLRAFRAPGRFRTDWRQRARPLDRAEPRRVERRDPEARRGGIRAERSSRSRFRGRAG